MSIVSNLFASLQKVGKALMLPVSVLPIAGILLGVGSAEFSFLPEIVSSIMKMAGGSIFSQMPLLFAVGVALGFTNNDGVAALAGIVGYGIMVATLNVVAQVNIDALIAAGQVLSESDIESIMKTYKTGVAGGILSGGVAAFMFNRYFKIELPQYLGFFAGKRFVPIATGGGTILLGLLLSVIWPPIGGQIAVFSNWAANQNPQLAFAIYGFVERGLIPFGLHHIWNVPFFFEAGSCVNAAGEEVTGVLGCYLQADDASRELGNGFGQLAGGFMFKMFGLPAAAIAIWHSAKPENRVKTGGIMISVALTAFLTGITEPIEFAFMFAAPMLYALHMVLAASAYFLSNTLEMVHGTTFSHGLIDFILLSANSQKLWMFIIFGGIYALVYYVSFRFLIAKFNLKTPGREDAEETVELLDVQGFEKARQVLQAYGGPENIVTLDSCITRLRIQVVDVEQVDKEKLKQLGASGVIAMGNGVQAIMGTIAETLRTEMEAVISSGGAHIKAEVSQPESKLESAEDKPISQQNVKLSKVIVNIFGGIENVLNFTACAGNRLRVEVKQEVDLQDLLAVIDDHSNVKSIVEIKKNIFHIILNEQSIGLESALKSIN